MHEIREREGGREAFKNCKEEHKNKKTSDKDECIL